jgi:hypothetical protein
MEERHDKSNAPMLIELSGASESGKDTILPRSVNLHFWRPCNMRCGFCFATYEDTRELLPRGHLERDSLLRLIDALANYGDSIG